MTPKDTTDQIPTVVIEAETERNAVEAPPAIVKSLAKLLKKTKSISPFSITNTSSTEF